MNVYVKQFDRIDDLGRPLIPTIDDWDNAETAVASLDKYTEMRMHKDGKTIFVHQSKSRCPLYIFNKEAMIASEVTSCPVCQTMFLEKQTVKVYLEKQAKTIKGNFCHNCCTKNDLDVELIEHVDHRIIRSINYQSDELYPLLLKLNNDLTRARFTINKDNFICVSGYRKIKIVSRYEEV